MSISTITEPTTIDLSAVDEPLTESELDSLIGMSAASAKVKTVKGSSRTSVRGSRAWSRGGRVD